MPTDLNILKKAFQNATATYEAAKPWDEPLDRRESVTTDQTFAAPVIPGDVGGWMASGGYPYQSTEKSFLAEYAQEGAVPPSQTYHETYPGREGYNDVDFVPYNWGTNRFGSKGGALLGHPISWEVVGPTSKSPFLHWQWAVNGTNNTLTLEAGLLTAAGGYGVPTVEEAYNLSATGISDYNGGLYVLVTLTGDEVGGMLTVGSIGLIPTNLLTSRFELFRVNSYSGQVITLESSKPLSSYFTLPGSPKVRSITLLRPKVTRLAGFPLSLLNGTTQRNQVFAFLPPESAAVSEYMPPYNGGTSCPAWSVTGDFDDAGSIPAGATADYGTPNLLPIPAPVFQTYGYVTTAPASAARWNLFLILTGTNTIAVGQLVRVQNTMRATLTDDGVAQTFGWFEAVTSLGATGVVTLRRVPEVNSSTGAVFYGNGPVSAGTQDTVIVEVYDNIGTIFTDPVLSISKVVAARLDHLIDPSAEGTSFRNYGSTNPARLGTPPGPAIFDTVTGSRNPGNLSDLGFRVVLFPAKSFGGVIAPDFDNPITGNRVVLDPTLPATTEQYLEVDYSAGVLYLSHPPVPGAGCAVAPTGIIPDAVNNPRNEVVLYAACVPYSREPSQRGGGVRVTVSRLGDGFGSHDSADIYGQRVVLELNETVGTNIANGSSFNIAGDATKFPARTGWFRFGEVDPVTGAFTSLSDPYYYPYGVVSTPTNYIVQIVAMGIVIKTTTANTRVVFLKSPVKFNNPWDSDAVRGSSKRFDRINFRGGRTVVGVDGSLTLTAGSTTLDEAYRAGDPSTPGAGRVITVDGGAVEAQPDDTAGGDTFNASFRVDTTAVATNAAALVGFDFKGSGAVDPYAGFIDRRVFAPTTGDTVLADPFTCDVAVNVVTVTTGGNKFWTSLGVPRSLLMIPFDLIEIEGVTYLILSLDSALPTGSSVVIVNLDGTAVNLTLTGVTAKVYRTRFYTSRGNTGSYPLNFNSWFAAQSWSETLNGEPIGALNLFAGSNTAISPGDGGGSTAALSFWSKFVTVGSTLEVRSPTYFDTFGRLNSSLTREYFNTSNLADYRYRGDYVTRAVKDLNVFTGYPVIGHIVEDYTYDQYRYDYLSLLPLLSTVLPYTATTTVDTNTNGELVLVTALNFELIPYGSAILEVLSVDSDTTMRGLYLVYSGKSLPSTTLYIKGLDNGTAIIPSVTGAGGQSVVFRLYAYSAQGRNVNAPYWDSYGVAARTHTPTHTIAVGSEANAVGLAINSPDMKTGTLGDRYAYRVSYGDAGTDTQPSNNEIAALDSYGYHKANDYLYLSSRTITKQINLNVGQNFGATNNPEWHWIEVSHYWQGTGNAKKIKFPLNLPRSSTRTDSTGVTLTHRTRIQEIKVTGNFGAGAIPAHVELFHITVNPAALPTSTPIYLGPALTPNLTTYDLAALGDTQYTIGVWADLLGTLPVYVDNTSTDYYYVTITSSNNTGTSDLLYGLSVTYTDPGPRNY